MARLRLPAVAVADVTVIGGARQRDVAAQPDSRRRPTPVVQRVRRRLPRPPASPPAAAAVASAATSVTDRRHLKRADVQLLSSNTTQRIQVCKRDQLAINSLSVYRRYKNSSDFYQ